MTVLYVSAIPHFVSCFLVLYMPPFSFQHSYAPSGPLFGPCMFGNDGTASLCGFCCSLASSQLDHLQPALVVITIGYECAEPSVHTVLGLLPLVLLQDLKVYSVMVIAIDLS